MKGAEFMGTFSGETIWRSPPVELDQDPNQGKHYSDQIKGTFLRGPLSGDPV
jgi:hypothetical protein